MANISNTFYNYLKTHSRVPVIFVVLEDQFYEKNIFAMKKLAEKVTDIIPIIISDVKDK